MRMKKKQKLLTKVKAVLLAVVIFCSGMGICSMPAYAAKGNGVNDAKQGVVCVQFYLKGAGFYITDGENFQWIADFGTNGEGTWSSGSGFFVGNSGEDPMYIVTNHHVVSDYIDSGKGENFGVYTGGTYEGFPVVIRAESCELRVYYDDDSYDVAYVDCYGDMEDVDLAVLKLREATDKREPLQIMVPTNEMVGTTVYTIGYPGNADNDFTSASRYGLDDMTVHKGSITKFVANAGKGVERIQIDAVVQHGNSGGPLVTEDGYVIGVNTNLSSNSPYENQIEVDYYAINASELVNFLNKNAIPYEMAGQGGSSALILIIVVFTVICVAAAVAVMVVLRKKKTVPATEKASAANASAARSQTAKKSFIRSMAAQHNGLALVVSNTPVLIGRDPANCKLVYADGTVGVSGRHCSVSYDATAEVFILTDLRSTYGTFLMNGQKLNANVPYRLKPGESFYVGDKANVIRVELG